MWDRLKQISSILAGQSILSCLDLKSIVRLETALGSSEQRENFRPFLSYYTQADIEVLIPQEISKLKWLQTHNFRITRAIVHMDKLNAIFDAQRINEIELVDNMCSISRDSIKKLPNNCFYKVVSVCFSKQQNSNLMVELFSCLHNLHELSVNCCPSEWILTALQRLHRGSSNNVLIMHISSDVTCEGSVTRIAECSPKLQSLSVSFDIFEDSLLALSTHCPLLKDLNFPHIPWMFNDESCAKCALALSCIHSIATPCKHMFHGDLVQYTIVIPYLTELREVRLWYFIDKVLIPLISQYCLKLEIVDIGYSSHARPLQILQLLQNNPHVHTIEIDTGERYTEELLFRFVDCCPNLRNLNLCFRYGYFITDVSLLALSEHCPNLQDLSIFNYNEITEAGVLSLVQNCKHLRKLLLHKVVLSEDTLLSLPETIFFSADYCSFS